MQNTKLNFAGQTIFVGIDVHSKSWAITIMYCQIRLRKFSMDPSVSKLLSYLHNNYPGAKYYSVYEAGYCGYWIDRRLNAAGITNLVVNPADVPTKNKEKRKKTDRVDSTKLARELMNKNLDGIYIPTTQEETLRILTRSRTVLSKDQARIKNRIKGLLYFVGIPIPDNSEMQHWSRKFIDHLQNLNIPEQPTKITIDRYIRELLFLRGEMVNVVKDLRKIIRNDAGAEKIIKRLMTVPGIGFTTAVTFYSEVMNLERFNSFERLASYIGLAPDVRSSGEKEKVLGLSERHNSHLRSMLIESAWMAIRVDPGLTQVYGTLKQRMQSQLAIIRIAKKLLKRMAHVWMKNEDYVIANKKEELS